MSTEPPLNPGAAIEHQPSMFRPLVRRTVWTTVGAGVLTFTLAAAGSTRQARLTLNWVDNSGGAAKFTIERRMGTTGTYAPVATTGVGITTYTDSEIVGSTTYCYRVKGFNASGESGYSNEACASWTSRTERRR